MIGCPGAVWSTAAPPARSSAPRLAERWRCRPNPEGESSPRRPPLGLGRSASGFSCERRWLETMPPLKIHFYAVSFIKKHFFFNCRSFISFSHLIYSSHQFISVTHLIHIFHSSHSSHSSYSYHLSQSFISFTHRIHSLISFIYISL